MADLLLNEAELFAAFRLLFASDAEHCGDLLESVQEAEIKSAFRKKALQTHPDRFAFRDAEYQKLCSERFIEINNAYETLTNYLKAKEKRLNFKQDHGGSKWCSNMRPKPRWQPADYQDHFRERSYCDFTWNFRKKDLPRRHLRFGEFLYYSGAIEWKDLVRALVWQKRQRPRIGEIAQRWRWINESQVIWLIDNGHPGKLIGQLMLNYNLINLFQLNVLLRQQKKVQKPIGEYFTQQRMATESEIQGILRRQKEHNLGFRRA